MDAYEADADNLAAKQWAADFGTYLDRFVHLMATLWDMGVNAQEDGREPSFPRNLDDDIKRAIDSIQTRLRELADQY